MLSFPGLSSHIVFTKQEFPVALLANKSLLLRGVPQIAQGVTYPKNQLDLVFGQAAIGTTGVGSRAEIDGVGHSVGGQVEIRRIQKEEGNVLRWARTPCPPGLPTVFTAAKEGQCVPFNDKVLLLPNVRELSSR